MGIYFLGDIYVWFVLQTFKYISSKASYKLIGKRLSAIGYPHVTAEHTSWRCEGNAPRAPHWFGGKSMTACKKYNVTKTVRMSSSLKFCMLAAGEADIYAAEARAYEWDVAAGHAILVHAGGFFTTHEYKEIHYGKKIIKTYPC